MTLVTWRPFALYDNQVWLRITYDSPMYDDNDVPQDPTATWAVTAIEYQNLMDIAWHMDIGNRTYTANPGTQPTLINLPKGQQFPLNEAPAVTIRPD